jgi:5-formyltetrahydrofolate cyclo-ligase
MTSDDSIARDKSRLRLRARAARRAVTPELRAAAAEAIASRVLALPEFAEVRAVLLYGATPEEADPSPIEIALRARGVRIAYPRVAGPNRLTLHWVDDPTALAGGAFGLLEPAPDASLAAADDLDAVVVPGVAFDERGFRLGFGGGYYDVLLGHWAGHVPTVGIAYDEQIVNACPAEAHDRAVDVVVTPTRTIRCATASP